MAPTMKVENGKAESGKAETRCSAAVDSLVGGSISLPGGSWLVWPVRTCVRLRYLTVICGAPVGGEAGSWGTGCGVGWSARRSNAPRSERPHNLFWCREIRLNQTESK